MKTREQRTIIVIAATLIAVTVLVLAAFFILGADGEMGGMIAILPAIIGGTVAPMIAISAEKKKEEEQQTKRKRKHKPVDRYTLMHRLVDDLNADERAYLRRRIRAAHKDGFAASHKLDM